MAAQTQHREQTRLAKEQHGAAARRGGGCPIRAFGTHSTGALPMLKASYRCVHWF